MQILYLIQNAAAAWTVSLLAVSAQTEEPLTDRLIYMDGVANCFDGTNNPTDAQDCIGLGTERCMGADRAQNQTTSGMMFCARAEGEVWDRLLKSEHREAVTDLRQMDAGEVELFPEFANREAALRAAPRAWIALRDADCQLEYAMLGAGDVGTGIDSSDRRFILRYGAVCRTGDIYSISRRSNAVIRIIDMNNSYMFSGLAGFQVQVLPSTRRWVAFAIGRDAKYRS